MEGDCDDGDSSVGPGVDETPYDGVDNDCDESTPDDDLDGDGYGHAEDCDDEDDSSHPGAQEDPSDGADNDCDGEVDERFEVEVLDASCDCGLPSALDVDSAGQVHVAYYDQDLGYLEYILRDSSGSWGSPQDVVASAHYWTGYHLDAVCDGADRFQIAYTSTDAYSLTELDFIYRDSSGSWSHEYVVDDYWESGSTSTGWYVGIDVDSSNMPSFAYYDDDNGVPVVADFSSWGITFYADADIYYAGPTGFGTGIAVDSAGDDHVTFYDPYAYYGFDEEIQYSKLDDDLSSIVFSESVASDIGYTTSEGMRTSVAVKSDDTPCVAWWSYDDGDLGYACRSGGSWAVETVASSGNVGAWASLGFNSADEPYIAYYDVTSADLGLAHDDGSGWTSFTVDSGGDVGQAPSLAVDASDGVHISYYDATNQQLKYAYGQ